MQLYNDDCLNVLKKLPDNSVDSLVTDPPAGISFMGLEFDSDKGGRTQWIAWLSEIMSECVRVLKPGAHGLVWALPKTSHWTGTALEDAGFEVKDVITHLFGSGFPKSLNIGKAIDKKLGVEKITTIPLSEEAKQWDGFGTQLKPAVEFWFLVRKPLSEKTIVDNVLKHGTGGLNIDASRITHNEQLKLTTRNKRKDDWTFSSETCGFDNTNHHIALPSQLGRFPSHLLLSHSEGCKNDVKTSTLLKTHHLNESENKAMNGKNYERSNNDYGIDGKETVDNWQCEDGCPVKTLDEQSGVLKSGGMAGKKYISQSDELKVLNMNKGFGGNCISDSGGASRFFYCAKVSSSERGDSKHPTMKSIKLMKYLITLITPPNGIVLDPFMGSGSTGLACKELGFDFIGIEKEPDYYEIAKARIEGHKVPEQKNNKPVMQPLFGGAK